MTEKYTTSLTAEDFPYFLVGVVAGEDHGFVARFYARIPVRDDYAVVVHDRSDDRVARQADIAQIFFGDLTSLAGDIFDGFYIEAG